LRRGAVGAVSVSRPDDQLSSAGRAVNLAIQARDAAGRALSYQATGLPPGLSINKNTGVITGSATALGTYGVAVTVTDTAGVWDATAFVWNTTVAPRGALHVTFATGPPSSGNVTVTVTIANTGSTDVNGWDVHFDMPFSQDVGTYWDALVSADSNNSFTRTQVTALNRDYNSRIPAHGSVTFGFIGEYTGSSWKAPSNCRIGFNAC
jgi:hypothetical protein